MSRLLCVVFLLPILGCLDAVADLFLPEEMSLGRCPQSEASLSLAAEGSVVVTGAGQFPVIAARDSVVVVAFRGNGAHVSPLGRIDLVVSLDAGRTWSGRQVVVDGPTDDRNPALGFTSDGTLILAYSELTAFDSAGLFLPDQADFTSYFKISTDDGQTWSEPHALDVRPFEWSSPYGKIISHDGGVLLSMYGGYMPAYNHDRKPASQRGMFAFVLRSDTEGRTWSSTEVIGSGISETSLLSVSDTMLLGASRLEAGQGLAIFERRGRDAEWTAECLVSAAREIPGDLLAVPGGGVFLAYGDRSPPFGIGYRISYDAGATWSAPANLVVDGNGDDLGYPSSVVVGTEVVTAYYLWDSLDRATKVLRYSAGSH